jgi:hypothetical protein
MKGMEAGLYFPSWKLKKKKKNFFLFIKSKFYDSIN